MKIIIILLCGLLLALIISACDNSRNPVIDDKNANVTRPDDSLTFYEALVMSLWYTDDLYPDSAVAWRYYDNLIELRTEFIDSVPDVEITFVPRFSELYFTIGVDSLGRSRLRDGTFHELDSLNNIYGIISVDTSGFSHSSATVILKLEKPTNVIHILDEYECIPGIIWANADTGPGDWSNIYPWIYRNRVTFLVRRTTSFDCPSGCPGGRFYYFMETDTALTYIGHYYDVYPDDDPPPPWWEYARIAYYVYYGYPFL